jgi:hypothetical protein
MATTTPSAKVKLDQITPFGIPGEPPVINGKYDLTGYLPHVFFTDRNSVVFGYIKGPWDLHDPAAKNITIYYARLCLNWSSKVGGAFGMAEVGPFDAAKNGDTTISAMAQAASIQNISAALLCTEQAALTWLNAPVVGR